MEYRVVRAERPETALEILEQEEVALVLISDQRMPGLTGTEPWTRSLAISPDSVRVLLTAFTDVDALMDSINAANIYHFILKPWDPKELTTPSGAASSGTVLRERDALRDLAAKNADLEGTRRPPRAQVAGSARPPCAPSSSYVRRGWSSWPSRIRRFLELAGDWREATALFADIRGFTASSSAPAPTVVRLLDEYFSAMIDVIFRHQGTVEQLVGDEIVAFFGITERPRRRDLRGADRRRHGRHGAGPRGPLARRGASNLRHRGRDLLDRCGPPPSAPTAAGS